MPRSARTFLAEMQRAATYLLTQAATYDFAAYRQNEMLRFAVERNFITLGEAMSQLRRDFPAVSSRIPEAHRIAALRNVVIHRYWNVDDEEVWSILVSQVGPLLDVLHQLLADSSVV